MSGTLSTSHFLGQWLDSTASFSTTQEERVGSASYTVMYSPKRGNPHHQQLFFTSLSSSRGHGDSGQREALPALVEMKTCFHSLLQILNKMLL